MEITWTQNGEKLSGAPEGYNVYDFYPGIADLETATQAELDEAYAGRDIDGVGCEVRG